MARFALFRPKWKHSDWMVRRSAIERLTDETILAEIARTDVEHRVRIAAVERLTDDATLAELAATDTDQRVRVVAVKTLTNEATLAELAKAPGDGGVRAAAVKRLTDEAILAEIATTDDAQHVRVAAVKRLTDEAVLAEVARTDSARDVRMAAVKKLTDETVLAEIARTDSERDVRMAAVARLTKLGWGPADDDIGVLLAIAQHQWDEVLGFGAVAVGPLLEAIEDRETRVEVVTVLGRIGDAGAVERLVAALDDEHAGVREKAAEALGAIRDARAVEPLVNALADGNWEVRSAAAEALGRIGDPRAAEPLAAALPRSSMAADALAKIGAPAIEVLLTALEEDSWEARQRAAVALGKIGDARAVEPLLARLKEDRDTDVQKAAATALGQIGTAAVSPLVAALGDADGEVPGRAAAALEELGWEPADDEQRALLAAAQRRWKDVVSFRASATAPLLTALESKSSSVRVRAAEALGKIRDRRAVERLVGALGDRADTVRQAAAEALGKIGDMRAFEPLVALVEEDSSQAAIALQQLDSRAAKPVLAAYAERKKWQSHMENGDWRDLCAIGDQAIAFALRKDWRSREKLAEFLSSLDPADDIFRSDLFSAEIKAVVVHKVESNLGELIKLAGPHVDRLAEDVPESHWEAKSGSGPTEEISGTKYFEARGIVLTGPSLSDLRWDTNNVLLMHDGSVQRLRGWIRPDPHTHYWNGYLGRIALDGLSEAESSEAIAALGTALIEVYLDSRYPWVRRDDT